MATLLDSKTSIKRAEVTKETKIPAAEMIITRSRPWLFISKDLILLKRAISNAKNDNRPKSPVSPRARR